VSAPAGRLAALRDRARWPFFARVPTAREGVAALDDDLLLDESAMARLRRLSLVSGQARTEGLAGEHRSRRRGASPEFADFKRYSQGDDFRRIDWNTYARLGGLFIRLSEITTELSVHILLDSSASMDWRGDPSRPSKYTAARRLAGALAYVALWGFDRVSIVPFADELGRPFGPVQGRAQVVPTIRHLQQMRPLGGTALAQSVTAYARTRSRPGLLLLVSDFLSGELEELQAALHDLRGRGWQTALLHIVDEAEIDPLATITWLRGDDEGTPIHSVELIDRESGGTLRLAIDDDVAARYGAAVAAWIDNLEALSIAEAAAYARVSTSWAIDDVTVSLLHDRGVVA
jgi:uncharacterized protein (DUF58 family)